MAESHREEIAKLEALYAGNPGGRVFVHLAEAYRKAGEHERARRILDEGLARHTDSASGYVVLGRVLADMQITGEAEIAFRRVLELDGGNLIALRWLGDLARQDGRNAEAAMHYRELLIRNPSNEEVRDLVEIVEREAAEAPTGGTAFGLDADDGADDAFAGLTLDTDEGPDQPAVSPPVSPAEAPAVSPPASVDRAPEPDITPWSAAPGQAGDAEEPPVEYGLVELDIDSAESPSGGATTVPDDPSASEPEAPAGDDRSADREALHVESQEAPASSETASASADGDAAAHGPDDRRGVFEFAAEDESDVVSSVGEDDADVLELDELRRDDEAEPVEIHLLDPSYEPSGDEDDEELVGDLDLSGLASTGPMEDADDYADDSFVADLPTESPADDADDYADDSFLADLSTAGEEEPPADELPGAVDVMDAALTLLPDETETETPDAETIEGAPELEHAGGGSDRPAHALTSADLAELSGAAEPAAEASGGADAAAPAGYGSETTSEPEEALAPGDVPPPPSDTEPPPPSDTEPPPPLDMEQPSPLVEPEDALSAADEEQPAPSTGSEETAEPEEPAPVAETRRGSDTGLMTETMAVLYRSQGFHDRAADVYRTLLRSRPGDERLAAKLREAEHAAGSPAGRKVAPEPVSPVSEDDAGEVWLRGVGAAWTNPAEASAEEATPYAWTGEADEGDGGEPISSYLHDLVSWKAGSGAWVQPDAAGSDEAAGDIEMPDWLDGPPRSETWSPESEAPAYPAAPASEADWSPPSQSAWDAAAADAVADSPAAGPSDAAAPDAALPDAAADAAAPEEAVPEEAVPEEWHVPSDSAGAQASGTQAADTGGGWTPFELEDDTAAGSAAPSAESPPAGLQPGPLPEAEPSDDDDLEMFRSWLQSLKK